jgi:c-di-GMP-binding flagellar brake protein YcgR
MTLSIDERRLQPRLEPAITVYVDTDLQDGASSRAQVLDWSTQGMRLLFRPAVDLSRGGTIAVSDADGHQHEVALVQWCRHKRHFTVAGIRACGACFHLHLASSPA